MIFLEPILRLIIQWIPNLFTLGNAICGFTAIVIASKIDLTHPNPHNSTIPLGWAAGMIFFAMVFDVLDGMLARLAKVSSDFGGQLDSLCDAISFGAAPAFIILKLAQDLENPAFRNIHAGLAGLFMACAIIRLAKYNIEAPAETSAFKKFKGLPSPAAAGCVASIALLRAFQPPDLGLFQNLDFSNFINIWLIVGSFMAALLMVSPFSYPHLTKHLLKKKYTLPIIFVLLLATPIFFYSQALLVFAVFWIYALNSPVRQVLHLTFRRNTLEAQQSPLDELYRRR